MSAPIIYDHAVQNDHGWITLTLFDFGDDDLRVTCIFDGRSSLESAQAFVSMLDGLIASLPAQARADAFVDLRRLVGGTPAEARLSLSNWLEENRSRVGRVAIVGADPDDLRVATGAFETAGSPEIRFEDENGALDLLGWEAVPVHPERTISRS